MSWIEKLWWRYMPGVCITVQWPSGEVVIDNNDPRWVDVGTVWVRLPSADPNDFYRPYLEKNVGKQGWDWNWGLVDNDAADNTITIKLRQKHSKHATIIGLMWT